MDTPLDADAALAARLAKLLQTFNQIGPAETRMLAHCREVASAWVVWLGQRRRVMLEEVETAGSLQAATFIQGCRDFFAAPVSRQTIDPHQMAAALIQFFQSSLSFTVPLEFAPRLAAFVEWATSSESITRLTRANALPAAAPPSLACVRPNAQALSDALPLEFCAVVVEMVEALTTSSGVVTFAQRQAMHAGLNAFRRKLGVRVYSILLDALRLDVWWRLVTHWHDVLASDESASGTSRAHEHAESDVFRDTKLALRRSLHHRLPFGTRWMVPPLLTAADAALDQLQLRFCHHDGLQQLIVTHWLPPLGSDPIYTHKTLQIRSPPGNVDGASN